MKLLTICIFSIFLGKFSGCARLIDSAADASKVAKAGKSARAADNIYDASRAAKHLDGANDSKRLLTPEKAIQRYGNPINETVSTISDAIGNTQTAFDAYKYFSKDEIEENKIRIKQITWVDEYSKEFTQYYREREEGSWEYLDEVRLEK